ncbi:MAG: T9SS type A sorting domain-containing protein [Bacteroidia bacterium]
MKKLNKIINYKKCAGIAALTLFLNLPCFAQQITPVVVNSTGKTIAGSGSIINTNVGETAVTRISNGSHTITQGFLQPANHTMNTANRTQSSSWSVYPNPTSNNLTVTSVNYKETVWARIIDHTGKEVLYTEISGGQISVNGLNAGNYQMQIVNTKKEVLSTKTITKIN